MRLVPDEGKKNARLVLIGEAPGRWENERLRPFVGPSGQKVNEWWASAGLQRSDFYITNVYPYYPGPGRGRIESIPDREIQPWVTDLHQRLAELEDPWLIVPTGNKALYALTGQGKWRAGEKKPGIVSHRGSIYEYTDLKGRRIKVIPTIHPAATFEAPNWERRCILDWQRIAGDAEFRELRLPQREHFISPKISDVDDFIHDASTHAETLSVDIENAPGQLLCVGLSYDPSFSITIPTTPSYWKDDILLQSVLFSIKQLLAGKTEKVLQNGLYDAYWLETEWPYMVLENYIWDTLAEHHCLDPSDTHSLEYQASIFTRQPYWKDEAKDPEEVMKYASDIHALWTYCGIDTCVELELHYRHLETMEKEGQLAFYNSYYPKLFRPLLDIMLHGVAMDDTRRARRSAQLSANLITVQDQLEALAGEPLHAKKAFSKTRLIKYLYETLGLPKMRAPKAKTDKPTTREVAIRRLMLRFPQKMAEPGKLILDHQRTHKLTTFLKEEKLDEDKRWRCAIAPYTETGRTKASKNPRGRGASPQNFDRELRSIVVPDPACIFLSVDLSQAEDRVVKMLTRAPRLIKLARLKPWEWDAHVHSATIAFGKIDSEINKAERYIGKRGRHGANYDLHGRKFSDELLKEGYTFTEDECQAIINRLHGDAMEVKEVYHKETRKEIMRTRCLTNSWGFIIDFTYDRLNDDLYRRGYAFRPQSDIGMLMNLWGLAPLHRFLQQPCCREHTNGLAININIHMHDSLIISTPPEHAWEVAEFMRQRLERPLYYYGEPMTVWCEFGLGSTWEIEHEFKKLPTRKKFDEIAHSLVTN